MKSSVGQRLPLTSIRGGKIFSIRSTARVAKGFWRCDPPAVASAEAAFSRVSATLKRPYLSAIRN